MGYNSTIRQKTGICPLCSDNKVKPLTKGMCGAHYWSGIRMKSAMKAEEKVQIKEDGVATLISDLDIIFSRYIRLKEADLYGRCSCFTCGKKEKWTAMDASHFIPRMHSYTRFSELNVRVCCQTCNRHKDGNLVAFAKNLELERPGLVETLQEHARITYKFSREELKQMISEYTQKAKNKVIK